MNHVLKRLVRPAAVLLAWGLMATGAAQAEDDPPGRVGRLAESRGQVWMLDAEQGEWVDAQRNRPLTSGDRVATDRDGRLELQIGSTVVRLDQRSDLELRRIDDDRIDMVLHAGAAAVRVREPEIANEVQLETAEGRFLPRGISLFRVDREERGSLASVTAGELQFDSSDSALTLRAGQRAELWLDSGDRRTHYSWSTLPNDDFERWVRAEDERDMRRMAQRPVSPEMTGADDLDRHGRWDNHPEYGSIWYPTVVQTGWAPYRYGHWAHVRPWGWTWVDDAPWGFAPFHYGRWVSWRGRWAWAPGHYVRRPVYAPAMVAWVGGSNFGVSVRIGGRPGPAVGWVPLAPREVYVPSYRYSQRYWGHVNQPYGTRPQPPRPGQRDPVMYTNQGVPGGVTAVSSQVLTQRQSVGSAARADDDVVRRVLRDQRALSVAAPPEPERPQRRRDDAGNVSREPGTTRTPAPFNRGPGGPGPVQVLREPAGSLQGQPGQQRPQAAPPPPFQRDQVPAVRRGPGDEAPRGVTTVPVTPVPRGAVSEPGRAPARGTEPLQTAPRAAPVQSVPPVPQGQPAPNGRLREPVGPAPREPQAQMGRHDAAPQAAPQREPRQELEPRRERDHDARKREKEARRDTRELHRES